MNNLKHRTAGFTLMEILVVMVIIGILVSIGINSLVSSQKKGRDARRKEDLHQITTALEVYYNDKGAYPESNASGQILGCSSGVACDWGTQFFDDQNTYMVQLPRDPVDGYQYYYESVGDGELSAGRYYRLYAYLENDKDKDLQRDENEVVKVYGVNCGSALPCNYGISSSNQPMPDPEVPTP